LGGPRFTADWAEGPWDEPSAEPGAGALGRRDHGLRPGPPVSGRSAATRLVHLYDM